MSKSYGKYLTCGNCWGNNTPFYKDRRRKVRLKNKQRIENMIGNGLFEILTQPEVNTPFYWKKIKRII